MRFIVAVVLILLALIHALPLAGVLGAAKLTQLYGIPVNEPNLALLLRHRALLFGLLAATLAYAAWRPELHRLALIAASFSVLSFLVLAHPASGFNAAIQRVIWVDWIALALLGLGVAAHAWISVKRD